MASEREHGVHTSWAAGARHVVAPLFLLVAATFFALHFVHLRADFPNHSPWMDWAKYTDEGWYGDAAIRHYLRGTWRLPGDFNPAAALPVWPFVEALVFRFTGVGIVAARALTVCVFAGILSCSFILLRMPSAGGRKPLSNRTIFAAAAVLMMSVSPFLFVFTRMAILEPLLILDMLSCLVTAYAMRIDRFHAVGPIVLGMLLAMMIGTKTTAIFLVPAVAYMVYDSAGGQWRRLTRSLATVAGVAVTLWGIYLAWLVHRGYWGDFRYLFAANSTTISRDELWSTIGQTLTNLAWVGDILVLVAAATISVAALRRRTWNDPVFVSLLLWVAGYLFFLAYHANMQPRYYLVVAVPLTMLLARAAMHVSMLHPVAPLAMAPLLLLIAAPQARTTLGYVRHPEYTFQSAANRIEQIVESDPAHSHTVLSISGSDLSLMTGVPSICDDFGTMDLEDRIAAYRPGWFVSWNSIEDDKMQALSKFYRLTRVAEFPAMDDPDRNLMIVYRLDPKEGAVPRRKTGRARTARSIS